MPSTDSTRHHGSRPGRNAGAARLRRGMLAALMAASLAGPAFGANAETTTGCSETLVTVWGVIAPVATFGLIKNLEAVPGVERASFDLRHALATVQIRPGATVTDDQLRAAVRSASYTPREISRLPTCPKAGSAGQ